MAELYINGVESNFDEMRLAWAIRHVPAANTQATVTRAGEEGVRHVCSSITVCLAATGLGGGVMGVNLRDGASGAGTIFWSGLLGVTGINDCQQIILNGLNIVGTSGNAMTLEFAAGAGSGTFESVSLTGYDIT